MSGHFLALLLDEHGVHGEFSCDEPDTAWCHTSCTIGCEVITETCRATHPQAYHPECQPILFLEDAGYWHESYIGPDCEPHSGPVNFEWSDDYYAWRYEETQENNGEIEKATMT